MSDRRVTALIVLVGLLAVTNGIWLLPAEGERRYTYERATITVEDERLTYDGARNRFAERNDLVAVDCDAVRDAVDRSCAFDAYLADEGPVEVSIGTAVHPEYVALEDGYYRRVVEGSDGDYTHDVAPVSPREILRETATNLSDLEPSDVRQGRVGVDRRLVVLGGAETTDERLADDELGAVYLYEGTHYTVVQSDATTLDRPIVSEDLRDALFLLGLMTFLVALLHYSEREGGERWGFG